MSVEPHLVDRAFRYSPEVREARREGGPVVALESTITAHGLPRPLNLETAREMEEAVRRQGAAPATIAVIDGKVRIGLAESGLKRLSQGELLKAGTRDLPAAIARGQSAATTVSATMFLAHQAGIGIMATGGIGGVHRDWVKSGDVSADLIELSRTPVAVVCSGVKTILDLPRTLEFLETQGIPVVGFDTEEAPAFYARKSGISLEHRLGTPHEAAAFLKACSDLGMQSGSVIMNPVPEQASMDREHLEGLIEDALEAARREGISGKAATPFLLSRLQEASAGLALKANRALAVDNAALAAKIAAALSEPRRDSGSRKPLL